MKRLLAKLALIAVALFVLFGVVVALVRVPTNDMAPRVNEGDLTVVFRLHGAYEQGDVVAFEAQGTLHLARVVALAGDTVDIGAQGLLVNGYPQADDYAIGETTQLAEGAQFPLTVPEGAVFALGDLRQEAVDSRLVGCIPESDTLGNVIGLFRHRGI